MAQGALVQKQRFQLLGLAIGQQGIIFDEVPSFLCPRPGARIARDAAGPAFDFDQIELVQRYDRQIDFVDAAVFGDEFEIRPGAKGLLIGQALMQVDQRLRSQGNCGSVTLTQRCDIIVSDTYLTNSVTITHAASAIDYAAGQGFAVPQEALGRESDVTAQRVIIGTGML
jgi:hypothetical protein